MVSLTIADTTFFAQQTERQVPEPTRTIVLMALLGIALLGLLLIAFTMLGASWVRKQGYRRRSVVPTDTFLQHEPEPTTQQVSRKMNDFNSADTFTGDDTVSGDETVVS
jgi:hypothetical protein